MLITSQAQGYPDLLTRSFLRFIHTTRSTIPIYGLVDYDPDGLSIFHTYAYGSISLAHENHALTVPRMRLLGLRAEDVSACADACNAQASADPSKDCAEAELPHLSPREWRRAKSMLGRYRDESATEGSGGWDRTAINTQETMMKLRNELQVMLILGVKAEIQVLDRRDGGLAGWLRRKLCHF